MHKKAQKSFRARSQKGTSVSKQAARQNLAAITNSDTKNLCLAAAQL